MKEEALDCTLWRTRFGRGYETDVTHNAIKSYLNVINEPDIYSNLNINSPFTMLKPSNKCYIV
jgi:hypothetical protein